MNTFTSVDSKGGYESHHNRAMSDPADVWEKPQGCEDSALRYRSQLQVLLVKKKMRQLGCRTPGFPWKYPNALYQKH
jgi:hypothetical protein